MRLIGGLSCIVLGLLAAALLIGLATDQGSSTGGDRVFVGILAGVFLATGALLVYLDWREHGRRPDLLAIIAGVIVGVLGVVVAAGFLAAYDVQLGSGGRTKAIVVAVVTVAGILPGMGVHRLVRRLLTQRSA
jgi:hypothetical protein